MPCCCNPLAAGASERASRNERSKSKENENEDGDDGAMTDRPRPDGNGMGDLGANKCRETDAIKYARSVGSRWNGTDTHFMLSATAIPTTSSVLGV